MQLLHLLIHKFVSTQIIIKQLKYLLIDKEISPFLLEEVSYPTVGVSVYALGPQNIVVFEGVDLSNALAKITDWSVYKV